MGTNQKEAICLVSEELEILILRLSECHCEMSGLITRPLAYTIAKRKHLSMRLRYIAHLIEVIEDDPPWND